MRGHAATRPDFASVSQQQSPNGREHLARLLQTYATALDELRAMHEPKAAGLIATLESRYTAAAREKRYLEASEHAARRLTHPE